jgi:hypothetical protein
MRRSLRKGEKERKSFHAMFEYKNALEKRSMCRAVQIRPESIILEERIKKSESTCK